MQARLLLSLFLCSILPLLAHSGSIIVVPNGQVISDFLLTASNGDTVSVASGGPYLSELALTITANITILFQGPTTIGLAAASPFWLNVTSNVTIAGAEVTFTSCGISLATGASLSQTADMTMTNVASFAVAVGDGATWTQSGGLSVTYTSAFDQDPALISLGVEARWVQAGPLTIDSTGATGVSVGSSSVWSQSGPVLIDASSMVVSPPFSLPPKVCAVYLESNSTWHSSSGGVSIITRGEDVHGVFLQDLAGWIQEVTLNINITDSAPGVRFEYGGTWQQNGVLTLLSQGYQSGVVLHGGGTWNQANSTNFVAHDKGYPVFFEGGGVWNQNAATDFQLYNQSYGVVFQNQGTWNQNSDTTITVSQGRGVLFANESGVWNQAPTAQISLTCKNSSIGIYFQQGGQWKQQGAAHLTLDLSSGVYLEEAGFWVQTSELTIDTAPGSWGNGVLFKGAGTWIQNGTATISTTQNGGASGVWFSNEGCAGCEWSQLGKLFLVSNHTGVSMPSGTWRQNGPVHVSVTSDIRGRGVLVGAAGLWLQRSSVEMNIVGTGPTVGTIGVALFQGVWKASAGSTTTIVGKDAVIGVVLRSTAQYLQGGTLNVTISNALVDAPAICAAVAFSEGLPMWSQAATATLKVVNGTGVLFVTSPGAAWQQMASATITIQGNATGIDISQGGQWTQQTPVQITTVAQGSSASRTKGFLCAGSSSCCNRIQSPVYQSNIIFSTGARNAGVRDDCPAASPSASPLVIAPVVVNTTATFSNSTPSISIEGTTSASSGASTKDVAVQLSLTDLRVGNSSASLSSYTVTQQVSNSTSGGANTTTTTTTYAAQLNNATSVAQAYTFFAQKATTAFAGTTFTVGAGSLKWSLNLTTTTDAANATDGGSPGLTLRYQLASLLNISAAAQAAGGAVIRKPNTPQDQMTTYIVRLDDSAVAQVELFDVALVDAQLVFINHSLTATNVSANGTTVRSYVLELQLPAFNQSLFYDPSLGLGVLLGGSTKSGGSGSDDNTALIVATAVAIPVAVVVVVGVVAVALLVAWRRKRTQRKSSLELDYTLDDHDQL